FCQRQRILNKLLNFFQHECYLYGDIPRVKTREGNVLLVDVPRAKPASNAFAERVNLKIHY
ncbi:MAG: hypothetical protein ACKOCO_02665, partial [Bacteroidota bacterium]